MKLEILEINKVQQHVKIVLEGGVSSNASGYSRIMMLKSTTIIW